MGGGSKSAGVDNTADGTDNVDCTCQSERSSDFDTLVACSIHSCSDHSHKYDGGGMNVTVLVV